MKNENNCARQMGQIGGSGDRLSNWDGILAAARLASPWRRSKLVMVIAAFDESGGLEDHEFVVFGGAVAHEEDWSVLTRRWAKCIQDRGIHYVSMKDALHFHNEFRGWQYKKGERDDLLKELANIATETLAIRCAAPMRTAEFKALPFADQKRFGDIKYCGFEVCIKGLLRDIVGGQPIVLICDNSEIYSVEQLKLYHKLRKMDEEARRRLLSISFTEDKVHAPLQLADMIAYCVRASAGEASAPNKPIVDELIEKLVPQRDAETSWLYYSQRAELGDGQFVP